MEIELVGKGNQVMGIQQNLVPYLVKAIQEQQQIIQQQSTQLTALQSTVAAQSTQVLQSQVTAQQIQIAQLMSQIQTLTERLAAANIPLTTLSTQ